MATISSIGTGKDYATHALWLASFAAGGWEGESYNTGEFTVTSSVSFSGHSTSAVNYILLRCATGESFRDDADKLTNALTYNQANGVGIRGTANYIDTISVAEAYVTIQDHQIQVSAVNGSTAVGGSGGSPTIENCILSCNRSAGSGNGPVYCTGGGTITLKNTVCEDLDGGYGQAMVQGQSHNIFMYNCTAATASDKSATTRGVRSNYGNVTLINCGFFGVSDAALAGGSLSVTTCMTDEASPPSGFTTVTYADQFEDTLAATPDWRLKTGADMIDAGTTDSTNIPADDDILGTSRPQGSAWDIGAHEFPNAAPPFEGFYIAFV